MWQLLEHARLDRQFERLPGEIQKRYEKWKDIVTVSGPSELRIIKGFHDEALQGVLRGYRSSSLNIRYRVIYEVVREKAEVRVIQVTPHEY